MRLVDLSVRCLCISILSIFLLAGCGGGGGSGSATTTNSNGTNSSVPDVTSLVAAPGDTWNSLSWVNPVAGFAGVMVRRDMANACPIRTTDGILITNTTGTTALDTGLTNGTDYCYTVFVHDAAGNYSIGSQKHSRPVLSFQTVSAGGIHSLGIKADGTLWAWGDDTSGQVGDSCSGSSCSIRQAPLQIGTSTTWTAVSAGTVHSVGINGGTLWSWGSNTSGQVGSGCAPATCTYISAPTQISTAANWASISAGGYFTVAIKTDGTLWTWGGNNSGQLGDGCAGVACVSKTTPTQVGTATNWASVAAGAAHVIALKTDGTLWAWGDNYYGQLGNGTTTGLAPNSVPTQIGTATNWKMIAAGDMHSLAIKTDGTLWAWGNNSNGQLGISCAGCTSVAVPTQVGVDTNWKDMDGGNNLTLVLKTDGTIWASGLIATSTGAASNIPIQVGSSSAWSSISVGGGGGYSGIGGGHFLALEAMSPSGHHLMGWGTNNSGELGFGNALPVWVPTLIN